MHKNSSQNVIESSGFKLWIERFEKFTFHFTKILSSVSSVLIFLLMILTAADVFSRSVFNSPITGTYELSGLMLAVIIFFSLGSVQMENAHLEIDVLTNKMSKVVRKWISLITSTILFILLILTTWQLYEYGARSLTGNQTTGDLGLKMYIFIFMATLGSFAFTLTYFFEILKFFIKVREKY